MIKKYGVIVETKIQSPLIWECTPMIYEDAQKKRKEIQDWPFVIRVAIFEMKYVDGNKNLIPEGED